MTRRSDLMCEDLFGCTHEAEVPVSDGEEIVAWKCRCGMCSYGPDFAPSLRQAPIVSKGDA